MKICRNITTRVAVVAAAMSVCRSLKLLSVLLGLTLMTSISSAQTIIINYTNTFDDSGNNVNGGQNIWMYWYSLYQDCFGAGYNLPMTNDPTMDVNNNTNVSGSLYVYSPFAPRGTIPPGGTAAEPGYGEQSLFSGTFDGGLFDTAVQMKILTITNISWYIHVLPGTMTNTDGNFGTIAAGLKSIGYAGDTGYYTNYLTIPGAATNGWVLMAETNAAEFQNAALNSGDTYAQGVEFYYNQYNGNSYPTNPVTFWIDNLVVNSSVAPPPPPPPPTLSISPAVPGLNLFTGSGTALYNRENIETTQGAYSWVGASGPVSFSITITNYPVGTNDAVQCQLFLASNPGTENDPDWNEANIIFMDLESDVPNGGGASWTFRYKTNDANDNTMLYNTNIFGQPGHLASIATNTALGTWTVTFNNNTNVTMTIPGGASTNFSIPDTTGATTALFANGVYAYLGAQAGNSGGANDHIVISEFKVTGSANDFDDNFVADAGVLSGNWAVNAAYTNCVQLVPPGNPYWVQWTSPANGFTLQSTPALSESSTNDVWAAVASNPRFTAGTNFTQLISTNDLPGGKTAFFTLVQRVFSQLLVLLPGETNAPGTATGKVGTPIAYSLGNSGPPTCANCGEVATIMAVDGHYFPVPGITDTIAITSSDTTATLDPANPFALVNGVGTVTVFFDAEGNPTITATDNTTVTIPADTSSPVLVGP